jgi:hypothetical protein
MQLTRPDQHGDCLLELPRQPLVQRKGAISMKRNYALAVCLRADRWTSRGLRTRC